MTSFTIIGTGNMGTAIGGLLADGGSTVSYITHSEAGTKPIDGDVVVLAVPYPAIAAIVAADPGAFAGKTVVDISNPLNFETFDSLVVPVGSSAAAELATALPGATVIKAFNTNFAATLASKSANGAKTTVLVAGDDAAAKKVLTDAVQAGGVDAIDAGLLTRAHELEALGFLQLSLAIGEKASWTGGFTLA